MSLTHTRVQTVGKLLSSEGVGTSVGYNVPSHFKFTVGTSHSHIIVHFIKFGTYFLDFLESEDENIIKFEFYN